MTLHGPASDRLTDVMTRRPTVRYRPQTLPAILLLLGWLVSPVRAEMLPGSAGSDEAFALCMRAERLSGDAKVVLLSRGLALAEQSIAADDNDAKGHFAVFCNLGRQMQLHPWSLGSLGRVRRLRREIDRALDLV